ncbi:hypothetical protein GCM10023185_13540 [Hymenobacter saemangeumensis]|uniref:Uncharacterized protein n=1 Tax=Hymenobacter saemangeumensis TaxID=1084522 RepID=A0ABP8I806_9BACT
MKTLLTPALLPRLLTGLLLLTGPMALAQAPAVRVGEATPAQQTPLEVNGPLRVQASTTAPGAPFTITQPNSTGYLNLSSPIGQSFTLAAAATLNTIRLNVEVSGFNASNLAIEVRSGEGTGGAVLHTQLLYSGIGANYRTLTLAPALALPAGTYTFVVTSPNPAVTLYATYTTSSYGGGRLYYYGSAHPNGGLDFQLGLTGTTTTTAPVLTTTATGRVGIGTSSPTAPLEVAGSVKLSGAGSTLTFPDNSVLTTAPVDTDNQTLSLSGSTLTISKVSGAGSSVTLPSGGADNLGNHTATQNLNLSNNLLTGGGSSGLRVDANGYVGIGTGTFTSQLSLGRTASSGNTTQGRIANYEDSNGTYFYGTGTISNGSNYGLGLWGGTGASTPFNGTTGQPAHLAVLDNGRVGIGTTSPTQMLDVNGTIRSRSGGIQFPDGTVQTTAASGGGTYPTPQARTLTLSFASFQPENGSTPTAFFPNSDDFYPTSGTQPAFRAPILLPQGATITGITLYAYDSNTAAITAELVSYAPATFFRLVATSVSSVNGTATNPSAPLSLVVDNTVRSYSVRVSFGAVNTNLLTVSGVQVNYLVSQPD